VTATGIGAELPFFSSILPVLDGGAAFAVCLRAISASSFRDWELIVVDDGSQDSSPTLAEAAGAKLIRTAGLLGPAAARNRGAREARGRFLFFLDADCEVHPDTFARAADRLRSEPDLGALFGSYDDDPAVRGAVARFRNLLHPWVHQNGDPEASTFW